MAITIHYFFSQIVINCQKVFIFARFYILIVFPAYTVIHTLKNNKFGIFLWKQNNFGMAFVETYHIFL